MKFNSFKTASLFNATYSRVLFQLLLLPSLFILLTGCSLQEKSVDITQQSNNQTSSCRPGGTGTGGTGRIADRGTGGTGISGMGGTGIIGVITGFSSICVNGEKIAYDATTQIKTDGYSTDSGIMRKGHFASVYATERPGGLLAESIVIDHTLEGPMTDIKVAQNSLSVLGVEVKWDADTYFMENMDNPISPSSLKIDDNLAVSGLWISPDLVMATRIDKEVEDAHVGASGVISQITTEGFLINKIPVRVTRPGLITQVAMGRFAYISGQWTGSEIQADLVDLSLPTPYSDRARRLNIEGYIDQKINRDQFKMLGSIVVTTTDKTEYLNQEDLLNKGMRVRVQGSINEQQQLIAEQIQIIH